METEQEYVNRIDPSLEFMNMLGHSGVYKVRRDDSPYVLKASDLPGCAYLISKESCLLQRAAGVEGITHLVHDYGKVGGNRAILKEYFEGRRLSGEDMIDAELQRFLARTVKELHELGFAFLDIQSRNTVVSPDMGHARFIDMNCYITHEDMPFDFEECGEDISIPLNFEECKERDFDDLRAMFA